MNKDVLKGKWKQASGEAKRKWGQLTDDDLTRIDGDADKLAGALQERYGYERDDARSKVDQWLDSVNL
ncbi:MAG: CsbD family protein [Spirochaetales bacterium]